MGEVCIIHQCVLCTANYSKIKIFVLMRTSKILCSTTMYHKKIIAGKYLIQLILEPLDIIAKKYLQNSIKIKGNLNMWLT